MISLIKATSAPAAAEILDWKRAVIAALPAAIDAYTPSMSEHIDIERIWRRSVIRARRDLELERLAMRQMPAACPFQLVVLLDEDFELDALLERIQLV